MGANREDSTGDYSGIQGTHVAGRRMMLWSARPGGRLEVKSELHETAESNEALASNESTLLTLYRRSLLEIQQLMSICAQQV